VQEKNILDRPLTIEELDESLLHCNLKSAAGADGFSNKLIKRCWQFLRYPLFNYANFCYETGILTTGFRSACIKLIPKKGDPSKLKNWRPISLLSNMYKILSRAINCRLKKIVNRVCSRAQKGYNSERYVQEVLINVVETIAHCKHNNLRGSVLAVDMAKAFDSLNHMFMKSVYKFFGFGENIIKWLNLLGNSREASILLGNGSSTPSFRIETGCAQGDNPSPNIFNFCEQILIFKLELDPRIARIPRPPRLPIIDNTSFFRAESNRETDINESLADDNTVMSLINRESLLAVKGILQDFAHISGLNCNFDKTSLLPVHPLSEDEEAWIHEAGFTVSSKIKLLGTDITAEPNELHCNFNRIIDKINSLISFWSRFRLTLLGRIAIAKTFLVSQINYLGCVLQPTAQQLEQMQTAINNFVKKNLQISDMRIYLSINKGGLGFFNLSEFLDSQRCVWLLRAKKNCIDNWRYDFHAISPDHDPLSIRASDVDSNLHPILFNICLSYEKFLHKYSAYGNNFLCAPIFENSFFSVPGNEGRVTKNLFGLNFYNTHTNLIRKLTFSDCFSQNGFKSVQEFSRDGIPLTLVAWMRLRNTLAGHNKDDIYPPPQSLLRFITRWKKGGKMIRKFFVSHRDNDAEYTNSNSFLTYSRLVGRIPDPETNLSTWLGAWSIYTLKNHFRQFIFNCRYNYLPLNNRLNAFMNEVDPSCTFCRIANIRPPPRDSFSHCFLHCIPVSTLLIKINTLLGVELDLDSNDFGILYWYGIKNGQILTNLNATAYTLVYDCFRYLIFNYRLRKIIPADDNFISEFIDTLTWVKKFNKKINTSILATYQGTNLLQALG
jgi:hypothetical protein